MKTTRAGMWIYGISQGLTLLLILVATALVVGAGWLMLEPREIPQITQRIEQSLNHDDSPYLLKVDKTILALGDFSHPLSVVIKNVKLLGREGQETADIPAMHISLNLWNLLRGHVTPDRITLIEPRLSLYQDAEGVVFLSGTENKTLIPMHSLFASSAGETAQDDALFSETIEEVNISSAALSFESGLTKMKLNIPAADIIIRQHAGIFRGRVDMKANQQGRKDLAIGSYFTYEPATQDLSLRLNVNDIVPADYAEILPELAAISEVKLPLSGSVDVHAILPLQLKKLAVNLTAAPGTLQFAPYFPQKISLNQLLLKGWVDGEHGQAKLENFLLKMKKAEVSATGEGTRDAEGKIALNGQAKVLNLSHKLLMQLWPEGVGSEPRKWVGESIVKAQIPTADFVINAPAGSLDQSPLPEEILQGKIKVTGAEVNYMPGFPPVKNGEGVVTITGNTLTVDIAQGNLLENTALTGPGKVFIPELDKENITIKLDLPVASTASDVVEFIKSTAYKLPPKLNFNQSELAGDVLGTVKLDILDNTSPVADDITFTIEGDVSNFSQPAFYKGMDITAARGKIIATDKKLTVDSTGVLQGQPLKFAAQLTGKQEDYHINAKLPHENLKQFGVDTAPYVTGQIGVDMHWLETIGGGSKIEVQADLTPSLIKIDDIEYTKPPGESAALTLQGTSQHEVIAVSDFQFTVPGRKEEIRGDAKISPAASRIEEVNFRKLQFAGTEATGTYRPIPGGYYVHASGPRLDISYRDHEEEKKQAALAKTPAAASAGPKPEWKIPALDLQLAFDEVIVSKDGKKKLQALKLAMQCDTQLCSQMDMALSAGKSAPFTMKIGRQNNHRVLTAYTPRADIVLREMNIFDDMRNGDMQITGIYQDELPNRPLVGKLTIGPHRVKNVPVLTKLLTVATFTGIVDALSGSGLMFHKLVAPFSMEGFVMHLKDAKTAGPSIGITADGTINLNQSTINLRGTVVPAYMFNALISSIPLLGNIFGVLAGDGLVAVRYSMLGDLENPDVTVNPLSALTPGFLRGFFSIFEAADPNAKGTADTAKALKQLDGEINQIKVPEARKTEQPSAAAPETAAPVIPVKEKEASVLSPKVKPTETR